MLKIHDWDKWQTYRRDRGQPPWIKIHRRLLRDTKWIQLSDSERGQLVMIWMLAADENGQIPYDPVVIRKLCCMDQIPDLERFIEIGFIDRRQDDVNMASQRRQHDAPEAETETETETEENPPISPHRGDVTKPSRKSWTRKAVLDNPPYDRFPGFEKFWKRSGVGSKAAAMWKWIEREREGTEDEMIQSWDNMVDCYEEQEWSPPHVSSWLNQRRWEDTNYTARKSEADFNPWADEENES